MRPDMAKVVTERPRHGSRNKSLKTSQTIHRDRYEDDDHGPTKHKVSRRGQYGWDGKSLSDLLGPLRGYLKKQVSRPWNKVYSDLCQYLDKRSVSGQHIWDHVRSEVDEHPYVLNGQLMRRPSYGSIRRVEGLYVHPVSGLLCWAPTRRYRFRPRIDPDVIKLDQPLTELRRMDGIWYRLEYESIPQWFSVTNTKTGETSLRRGTDIVKVKLKAQLSKRELADFSLQNTPELLPVPRKKLKKVRP
jgi:hypothetical protein